MRPILGALRPILGDARRKQGKNMENLGYKVGDTVIILGNAPTRGRIIDMRANAADNHGRTVVRVDVALARQRTKLFS